GGETGEWGEPVRQRQHRCRCPLSFPCSERFCRRHPGAQFLLESADPLGGLRELRAKTAGFPDSKFVAETDKGCGVGDAGMRLETLGQDHATFAVDLERLACAIEREGKLFALFRIGRIAGNQRLDFGEKRIAAGIERWPVERGMAIKSIEAVARQYRS